MPPNVEQLRIGWEARHLNDATDRFLSFVAVERRRHSSRVYVASLVAVLIALLLYQTQWLYLRPGLIVLLGGQVGDVLALLLRSVQLASDMRNKKPGLVTGAALNLWFKREELFIKNLAIFDGACQIIGFLALGYAFWISTSSLALALAIGLVYPVTFQFGISRRKVSGAIKELRNKRHELASIS
jgi:hypothetical protein